MIFIPGFQKRILCTSISGSTQSRARKRVKTVSSKKINVTKQVNMCSFVVIASTRTMDLADKHY